MPVPNTMGEKQIVWNMCFVLAPRPSFLSWKFQRVGGGGLVMILHLLAGKLTCCELENHRFFMVNQLFQWAIVAIWVYQRVQQQTIQPRCSMYGIFTYIWVIFGANVGKYSIHGASGQDEFLPIQSIGDDIPLFLVGGYYPPYAGIYVTNKTEVV